MVRHIVDWDNPPKLSEERKAGLEALANRPDSEIDYSDIPPLTEQFWQNAVRNPFYKPTNPPPTSVSTRTSSTGCAPGAKATRPASTPFSTARCWPPSARNSEVEALTYNPAYQSYPSFVQ